jgi:hypothetical protein
MMIVEVEELDRMSVGKKKKKKKKKKQERLGQGNYIAGECWQERSGGSEQASKATASIPAAFARIAA